MLFFYQLEILTTQDDLNNALQMTLFEALALELVFKLKINNNNNNSEGRGQLDKLFFPPCGS